MGPQRPTSPEETPVFHLKPAKGPAADAKRARVQARTERKKANDPIFDARHNRDFLNQTAQTVAAQAGLLPVTHTPFGGGSPKARDESVVNLTAKSQLAKARLQRLNQGGLLTPEQQVHEKRASTALATSRALNFLDRHNLAQTQYGDLTRPLLPHMTLQQIADMLKPDDTRPAAAQAAKILANSPTPVDRTKPGWFMSDEPTGTYGASHFDVGHALGEAAHAAPSVLGDVLKRWQIAGGVPIGTIEGTAKQIQETSAKLSGPDTSRMPHIAIPRNFLNEKAGAAPTKGAPKQQYADTLDLGHYSLTPEARKQFEPMIKANGYNLKDAPGWNDQDYVSRAFIKNDTGFGSTVRNLAADFGQQAALVNAPRMVADAALQSIEHHSITPLARLGGQMGQGYINVLPFVGDRPWLENLQERPFTTISALTPIGKGASLKLGRGLGRAGVEAFSGTREIPLPRVRDAVARGDLPSTTKTTVTAPASHEIITRGVQALHDAILSRAVEPELAARRPSLSDHGPRAVIGRAGSHLEKRVEGKGFEYQKQLARLQAGQEPHVALLQYMREIRSMPWLKKYGRPFKRIQDPRIQGAESAVFHGGFGTDSAQVVEALQGWAEDQRGYAKVNEQKAAAAREAGDAAAAEDYQAAAEKNLAQAADLESQAEVSLANPHALGDNQELVAAARKASQEQTRMRMERGWMDEPGQLWGDLQHRAAIVHRTEHPGSVRGGAEGTPEWHAAEKLLNPETGSREEFMAARAALHGVTPEEAAKLDATAEAGVNSPEARYELGRHQAASVLQRVAERRVADRDARQAERMRNTQSFAPAEGERPVMGAHGAVNVARAVATQRGVGMDVVDHVLRSAHGALAEGRGVVERRHAELDAHAKQLEDSERRVQDANANERLRSLERQLDIARSSNAARPRIQKIEAQIAEQQSLLEHYKPSRQVLEARSLAEGKRLQGMVRELTTKQIKKVIMETTTPEQRKAIGFQRLVDAVHEHMDQFVHREMPQKLEAVKNDAAANYKNLTGRDVLKAQVYGKAHAKYTEDLRAYAGLQGEHAPFHLRLRVPDESTALPGNFQSTGVQLKSGKFMRDTHFLLARDLEGLSAQAVKTKLMENLADSPMVMPAPPVGREIPAGWTHVSEENWARLKRMSMDANQVRELLDGWKRKPIPRADETGGVLISKNLQDLIEGELKSGDRHEVSRLLKATNTYRRWMLYSLPRTFVNNALGNPILGMVMGAGVKSWWDAMKILRDHPERIMHTELRKGPITNILDTGKNRMTGWQSFWRHANAFAEDQNRVSVYLLNAKRAFKKENGLRWYNHVGVANEHFAKYLRDAAEGKNPSAFEWTKKTAYIFGDMMKTYKLDPVLAQGVLFHRWVGHMLRLQATMPFKYPGRTAFLQQTAILADDYRKQHGVFPEWAMAYVPLWQTLEQAGGLPQKVTWSFVGSGVMPFTTPGQTFDLGTVGQPKEPLQSLLASQLSPLIRAPAEWALSRRLDTLEHFKDQHGDQIHALTTQGAEQGLQSIIANTPLLSTAFGRTGMSDNSVQVPLLNALGVGGQYPAFKAAAAHDPSMNNPTPFNHGLLADVAITLGNALGFPIRPLDAEGNRTDVSAGRTATFQSNEMVKRKNKEGERFWKASVELWNKDHAAWRKSKYNPASPSYQDPTK